MNVKKILLIALSFYLLSFAIAGCTKSPPPAPNGPPAFTEEIKIGAVLSLSGALAARGARAADIMRLAVAEINEAGGINGKELKLYIEDDSTNAESALSAVRKLVETEEVHFILGPMTSGAVNAVGPYVSKERVLTISPSDTSPMLSGQNFRDYVFRTCPSDALQGKAMAEIAIKEGLQRIVILAMNNTYGVYLGESAEEALAEAGIKVVKFIKYDRALADYQSELSAINEMGPDGIIHVGYSADSRVIYSQAFELGMDRISWIVPDGVYDSEIFADMAGIQFMAAAVTGIRPAVPAEDELFKEFTRIYTQKFTAQPEMFSTIVYDTVKMLAMAIEFAGSEEPEKVREALLQVGHDYRGVSGIITFDAVGDRVSGTYEVWKVSDEGGEYKFAVTGFVAF
ncbi:MAG: ABC transporter substrate-binding protein [Dethiobacter sp.]|jgi:ABC-type branched-subunit amino acid transport system substrate-binding protein|nr:ABC transporter substrate-binding protein [Dethiobacter sp.]